MKIITRIAGTTIFLIAYIFILWLLTCYPPYDHSLSPRAQFTPAEKKAINARLIFHGLHYKISIIDGWWTDDPFFMRDGQRCSFWGKNEAAKRH